MQPFNKDADFEACERIVSMTLQARPIPIVACCLMPNHWHPVPWARRRGDLGPSCQTLTITFAIRRNIAAE
jgi:hypothetical protein